MIRQSKGKKDEILKSERLFPAWVHHPHDSVSYIYTHTHKFLVPATEATHLLRKVLQATLRRLHQNHSTVICIIHQPKKGIKSKYMWRKMKKKKRKVGQGAPIPRGFARIVGNLGDILLSL